MRAIHHYPAAHVAAARSPCLGRIRRQLVLVTARVLFGGIDPRAGSSIREPGRATSHLAAVPRHVRVVVRSLSGGVYRAATDAFEVKPAGDGLAFGFFQLHREVFGQRLDSTQHSAAQTGR